MQYGKPLIVAAPEFGLILQYLAGKAIQFLNEL
jgi:hypothetical protein